MIMAQHIDAVMDRAIAERRIVGTVLIVRRHGKLVYERAAGLADRETGVPMQRDAIFRLSSLTKPIVAATILALVDAGKLAINDPVTRHLPSFRPKTRTSIRTSGPRSTSRPRRGARRRRR